MRSIHRRATNYQSTENTISESYPHYPLDQLVAEDNIERWTSLYSKHATQWLTDLPRQVGQYARDWELEVGSYLEGGTAAAVIGATQHDNPVVLKIHPPWVPRSIATHTAAETEAAAYRIWDGRGAPDLLVHDASALLLERITPAKHSPLLTSQDMVNIAKYIARPVNLKSTQDPPLGIPLIEQEVSRRFERASAKLHPEISELTFLWARVHAQHLSGLGSVRHTGPHFTLVHGDLKPKNILEDEEGKYRVIDPSPAAGSYLFDATLWVVNEPEGILVRCEEVAKHLNIDPQVIGSLAISLAIPEICLASPARADATLKYVKELAETNNLAHYFEHRFTDDTFMTNYVETEPVYEVIRKVP